jgi:RNA-directed DNA polymerase
MALENALTVTNSHGVNIVNTALGISCQPDEADELLSAASIRRCEAYVRRIQRKLDKAVADGDKARIRWYFHLISKRSRAAKILAVHKITAKNKGRYTAGIDKVALPHKDREEQNRFRLGLLNEIDTLRKPAPIRRVYIPKPNGKKRPLGIATMADRIVQEMFRMALDPIVEYHFSDRSFGFRPKRSCHDAIQDLFGKLCRRNSRRWIVEGDIRGCFDGLSHSHILNTLREWHVPIWAVEAIQRMLRSRIFYQGEITETEAGTPQGSILSPLLSNVALTSLDNFCLERFGWRSKLKQKNGTISYRVNPITRYADDWAVVCESKQEAERIKREIAQHLRDVVGVELSEEKTVITPISKGFSFLGFHFRKYKPNGKRRSPVKGKTKRDGEGQADALLIKPQKEKVKEVLYECKRVLKRNRAAKPEEVIHLLNAKLKGWAMYYRHVCSKSTFSRIDHEVWYKVYKWSIRRHPNKSKGWVMRRYFSRVGGRKLVFMDRETGFLLISVSKISIKRFVKINAQYRVYEGAKEAIEYWQKRAYLNGVSQMGSEQMAKLFKRQHGKCEYCDTSLTPEPRQQMNIQKHHVKPRSSGGDDQLRNLKLLHSECHRELHAVFSREKMASLADQGIDYVRFLKRNHGQ